MSVIEIIPLSGGRKEKKAERLIGVDDEVWAKLHFLKVYLGKSCINDVLRQIIEEWEEIKDMRLEIDVESS